MCLTEEVYKKSEAGNSKGLGRTVNALFKFLGQDLEDWKRWRFSFQLQWTVFLKLAVSRK